MNGFLSLATGALLLAASAVAGPIDGQSMTIVQNFALKSEDAELTRSFSIKFGDREPPASEIKDAKMDGNKFSFTTMISTPNGDRKTSYSGTVEGDTLKGTAEREGGQARPFAAKKK